MDHYHEEYSYTPLDETRQEIRLIRLEKSLEIQKSDLAMSGVQLRGFIPPPPDGSPLALAMQSFPLDEAPPYTCLSYCWGTPDRDQPILLSGKHFQVTANLRRALQIFTIGYGWVWADAICINQDDVAERNAQVRLMTRIYAAAREVVAHLGDPPGDAGQRALLGVAQAAWYLQEDDDCMLSSETGQPSSEGERMETTPSVWYEPGTSNAVYELFSSPWFGRAWVIQEAVVNANFWIWYGNARFPVEVLVEFFKGMQTNTAAFYQLTRLFTSSNDNDTVSWGSGSLQQRSLVQLHAISGLRDGVAASGSVPPIEALRLCRSADATDPRDKVYSLLGLMPAEFAQSVVPDYSAANSVSSVYRDMAVRLLQSPHAASALRNAGLHRDLPSWVPDWSTFPRYELSHGRLSYLDESLASVDVGRSQEGCISVGGAVVDRIARVLPQLKFSLSAPYRVASDQSPEETLDGTIALGLVTAYYIACAQRAYGGGSKAYPTGEPLDDAIWRTIVCDSLSSRVGNIAEARKSFEAYRTLLMPPELGGRLGDRTVYGAGLEEQAEPYEILALSNQLGRRGALTEKGYLAALPDEALPGDVVAVFQGSPTPFVLRPSGDRSFQLVGEAYVHGIMDGELTTVDESSGEQLIDGRVPEMLRLV